MDGQLSKREDSALSKAGQEVYYPTTTPMSGSLKRVDDLSDVELLAELMTTTPKGGSLRPVSDNPVSQGTKPDSLIDLRGATNCQVNINWVSEESYAPVPKGNDNDQSAFKLWMILVLTGLVAMVTLGSYSVVDSVLDMQYRQEMKGK